MSIIANALFVYSKLKIRSDFAEREQSMINQFAEKESLERRAEDLYVSPFERLSDIHGDTILLNSIIEEPDNLILIISDNSCGSCVENVLTVIQHTLPEPVTKNLIVIGLYENKRSFFLLSGKVPARLFLIDETSSLKDLALRGPLFFSIDLDFKIKSSFFPLPQYSVLTEKYLAQMMQEK
jgi:hypothetical protein